MELNSVTTPTTSATAVAPSDSTNAVTNSLNANKDMYLKLFLQTLQNQSPFDTLDNAQMMQQMSQLGFMEQVDGMKQAIGDLKEMQEGQQFQNASNLLGKTLVAINAAGEKVVGEATALRVTDGITEYLVGEHVVQAAQIQEVGMYEGTTSANNESAETEQAAATPMTPAMILEKEKQEIEQALATE